MPIIVTGVKMSFLGVLYYFQNKNKLANREKTKMVDAKTKG